MDVGEVEVEVSSKLNIESVSRLEANSILHPRKSISRACLSAFSICVASNLNEENRGGEKVG